MLHCCSGSQSAAIAPALQVLLWLVLLWLVSVAAPLQPAAATAPFNATQAGAAEADVMRTLRRAVHAADANWTAGWKGWGTDDSSHHCSWLKVKCDAEGHITQINLLSEKGVWDLSRDAEARLPQAAVLLPELAQLQRLEMLSISRVICLSNGIPAEWGWPGAFPHLTKLVLEFWGGKGPLPDIQPGALPQLQTLRIHMPRLQTTLPASWSNLPELASLLVSADLVGQLPAQWAAGMKQLEDLSIASSRGVACSKEKRALAGSATSAGLVTGSSSEIPGPPREHPMLPPEWATRFPHLVTVNFNNLGLAGTFASMFLDAFPSVNSLILRSNCLTGTLPSELFKRHPSLARLSVQDNQLSGMLPAAWSKAQVVMLKLDQNQLTGPAFPPAWMKQGALPRLDIYSASFNAQLNATLPPMLPWPKLHELGMMQLGVQPSIPASWCTAGGPLMLHGLDIGDPNLPPALPSCLASTMAKIMMNGKSLDKVLALQSSSHAPKASLALVLLVLPVLAAVAAAGRLWHTRKRRHKGWQAVETLPHLQQLSTASWSSDGSYDRNGSYGSDHSSVNNNGSGGSCGSDGSGSRPTAEPTEMIIGVGRPAQLAALLQARICNRNHSIRLDHHWLPGTAMQQSVPSTAAAGKQHPAWLPPMSLCMAAAELQFVVDEAGVLVQLGSGNHAAVYLADMQGRQVAVKVFLVEQGRPMHFQQEVAALRSCTHTRILPLYGVLLEWPLVLVVMELKEGGSLRAALQRPGMRDKLRWDAGGRQVALDVAEGLHFLHSEMRVMHSDLKAANVLLSADCRACIADLGLAQMLSTAGARTALGFTQAYAAPEQLMGQRCTLAADMYSFGILLVELTTQTLVKARQGLHLPEAPRQCSQGVLQLIQDCLSRDPAHRPTAAEALRRLQE